LNQLTGKKLIVIESIQTKQQRDYSSQLIKQLSTWQLITCSNYDMNSAMAYTIDAQ